MRYEDNFWRFSSIPDAAEPPKDTEQKTEEEKKKEEENKEKEKKKDSEQEKTEAGKLPDAEQKVVALQFKLSPQFFFFFEMNSYVRKSAINQMLILELRNIVEPNHAKRLLYVILFE